jgi:hypothetical protein
MRFVPADKQTDETSAELKPAKWPVKLVFIANDTGREFHLDNERIQTILSPAIQATCRLKPEETTFFLPPLYPRHNTPFRTPACPNTLPTSQPRDMHRDTPDGAPNAPPRAETRLLISRGLHMSSRGPPKHK